MKRRRLSERQGEGGKIRIVLVKYMKSALFVLTEKMLRTTSLDSTLLPL